MPTLGRRGAGGAGVRFHVIHAADTEYADGSARRVVSNQIPVAMLKQQTVTVHFARGLFPAIDAMVPELLALARQQRVRQDGQIVGLRTFMRWDLVTGEGETLRCARAVDTATHPDHQGKGIFRRLTEEAVEVARDDGIAMIFNTPNEKSKPGYLKMGWREVGEIGALIRPSLSMLTRVEETAAESPETFV